VHSIVFPGGDTSVFGNLEYRIPIVGPVVLAAFADLGMNFIARESQLKIAPSAFTDLNSNPFGCPSITTAFTCGGGVAINFPAELKPVPGTNYRPRMSTGLELQAMMPIINAPLRVYWAYNPLRLDTVASTPSNITRSMFPTGGAGDFSFQQAIASFAPSFILREPRKTFRFTVSTTF